jgi:hypothetical protein
VDSLHTAGLGWTFKPKIMEKLQPEKIVQLLSQKGVALSIEQAKQILDFLKKLAEIAIDQYLRK